MGVNINTILEARREFMWLSRAWFGRETLEELDCKDEIILALVGPGGEAHGEFLIRWYEIDEGAPMPRLEVNSTAWSALAYCADLIHALAALDGQRMAPSSMVRLLRDGLGFADVTPTEEPRKLRPV